MKKIIIFLLLWFFYCQGSFANTGLTFGPDANGKQFSIPKGRIFWVDLPSNPTTGYDWHLDRLNLKYFRFINSGFKHPSTKLIGAPGKKWFEFKAIRAGNCGLSLLYYRSWEGKKNAAKKYKLRLNITK